MINIPSRLKNKLSESQDLYGFVNSTLATFYIWFSDNKMSFFQEYTDHGINHLQEVIDTADSIISDNSWDSITAQDCAALITATLLHDCAMHISEDGFYSLIEGKYPTCKSSYTGKGEFWPEKWSTFFSEAKRFDDRKLRLLFGDNKPIKKIPNNKLDLSGRDKLLIGEFLRRNHAILSHEISLSGIPGPGLDRLYLRHDNKELLDLFGFIARSHNMGLREAVDILPYAKRRSNQNIHVPFIMGVLRISDYIQIHSQRAEKQLLSIKSLSSPNSTLEWRKHNSIKEINQTHDDPEAIYIDAEPNDAKLMASLSELFLNIQKELDSTWSIFGEIYGRIPPLNNLGITIRRLRSSLDDLEKYIEEKKPNFIPRLLKLKTSDTDMISLLISPLYGDNPEVGIRELMQNSIDACIELIDILEKKGEIVSEDMDREVIIRLEKINDDSYTLSVTDPGIGMTLDIIQNYFLNIGASFRKSDYWKAQHETDGHSNIHRTGRFGIGMLAAYLLGEEIKVQTRHVSENQGYEFNFKRDSDSIILHKKECNIGTKISINVDTEIALRLIEDPNKWDWYCLTQPKVVRIIAEGEDKFLAQTFTVPNSGEDIEDTIWNRTRHEDFDDIFWSYNFKKRSPFRGSVIICNGIIITQNPYRIKLPITSNSTDINISCPSIVVFDQDGRMPINLQRNELIESELPFQNELLIDISTKLSKSIINTFLDTPRQFSNQLIEQMIKPTLEIPIFDSDNSFEMKSRFIKNHEKLYPLDCRILMDEKPSELYVDLVNLNEGNGAWRSVELQKIASYYFPINYSGRSKNSKVSILRWILNNHSYRNNYFDHLPAVGRRIFISKKEIEMLVAPTYFPKTLWARLKTDWENENWKIVSIGVVKELDFDPSLLFEELQKIDQPYFAIIYFDWSRKFKEPAKSVFHDVWTSVNKNLYI